MEILVMTKNAEHVTLKLLSHERLFRSECSQVSRATIEETGVDEKWENERDDQEIISP